jgi:hypothetical protein
MAREAGSRPSEIHGDKPVAAGRFCPADRFYGFTPLRVGQKSCGLFELRGGGCSELIDLRRREAGGLRCSALGGLRAEARAKGRE